MVTHCQKRSYVCKSAVIDDITGLPDCRHIFEKIDNVDFGTMVFIELDNIDFISSQYGNRAANLAFKNLAQHLQENTCDKKEEVFWVRSGELIVLLKRVHLEDAAFCVQNLVKQINKLSLEYEGEVIDLYMSLSMKSFDRKVSPESFVNLDNFSNRFGLPLFP